MASAGGKKGKKKRGQTLDLNTFLQNGSEQAGGKAITIKKSSSSWADQMDDFETQKTVVLPTAPSSVRGGLKVDMDRIPTTGPFKVFVANVSYDADEALIASMFKGLDVVNVHLPVDDSGRFKGFGYVEFGNREDLIDALEMDDLEVGGRKLRIDLKTPSERDQQRAGYSSFGRSDGDGGAEGSSDWRSGPRPEPGRDRYGGGGGFGGGGFGGRDRDRDREPMMASKPGSKYDAVPAFSSYGRGSDRGGGGFDRRGDDQSFDRYGSDRGGFGRRGDDRGYSRDDRFGDRDGPRDSPWSRDSRGGPRYDSRDGPRYDSRDGPRYDSRDGPRYDSRDGPRYDSRDGPRYDSRDGPRYDSRDGPRYDSRDGPRYDSRDGPRYDSRDGARYDSRDGPRYDSRDGPRYESRDGPRYDSRDGPRRDPPADGPSEEGDSAPAARPKLNLKPRSAPPEEIGKPAVKSSIFGGAKPVDTAAREREVEDRLKGAREPERERERPTGSQRRAEANRDIRLTEGARKMDEREPSSSENTNGKPEHAERRERQPRPPPQLEETPADFAAPSRFSALALDEEDE